MTIPLEQQLMSQIGLGNNYHWHNGSDCRSTRERAVIKLPEAIQTAHDRGEPIAAPYQPLIERLGTVAQSEGPYLLTKTWQTAANIIRTHITHAESSPEERQKAYDALQAHIEAEVLPPQEEPTYSNGMIGILRNY